MRTSTCTYNNKSKECGRVSPPSLPPSLQAFFFFFLFPALLRRIKRRERGGRNGGKHRGSDHLTPAGRTDGRTDRRTGRRLLLKYPTVQYGTSCQLRVETSLALTNGLPKVGTYVHILVEYTDILIVFMYIVFRNPPFFCLFFFHHQRCEVPVRYLDEMYRLYIYIL